MRALFLTLVTVLLGCSISPADDTDSCASGQGAGIRVVTVSDVEKRDGEWVVARELPIHYVTGIEDDYPCATATWKSGFGCTEEGQCISKCRVELTLTGCPAGEFEVKLRTLE